MLRSLHLTKLLPVILIFLTAKIAYSQPVSESYKYPISQNSNNMPVCYGQRKDGRTLNLSSLCGKISESTTLTNQSEADDEPTTWAEQRQYEADLNTLKNQMRKLPDKNTLISHICLYRAKCPSSGDILNVSIINLYGSQSSYLIATSVLVNIDYQNFGTGDSSKAENYPAYKIKPLKLQ